MNHSSLTWLRTVICFNLVRRDNRSRRLISFRWMRWLLILLRTRWDDSELFPCCFEKKQNVSQSSWWTVATDLKMFRSDTILLRYSECSIFWLRCDVFSYYSGFILQIFVWLRVKMHLLFNIFRYLDTQMLQLPPVQEGCWTEYLCM